VRWRVGIGCAGALCARRWPMRCRRRGRPRGGRRRCWAATSTSCGAGWWPICRCRASSRTPPAGCGSGWSRSTARWWPSPACATWWPGCGSRSARTARGVMVPQTHPPGAEAEVDFGEFAAVSRRGADAAVPVLPTPVALWEGGARGVCEPGAGVVPGRARARLRGSRWRPDRDVIRYDNLKPAVIGGGVGPATVRASAVRGAALALRVHLVLLPAGPGGGAREGRGGRRDQPVRCRHLTPVPHVGSLAALQQALAAADARDDARRIGATSRPSGRRPPGRRRCCVRCRRSRSTCPRCCRAGWTPRPRMSRVPWNFGGGPLIIRLR
jgi:hypothetical protein